MSCTASQELKRASIYNAFQSIVANTLTSATATFRIAISVFQSWEGESINMTAEVNNCLLLSASLTEVLFQNDALPTQWACHTKINSYLL